MLNQLVLMREGVRRVEAMTPFVKDLKDDEIDALASHYAKLAPKASDEPVDQALAKRGAEGGHRAPLRLLPPAESRRTAADAAAGETAHRLSDRHDERPIATTRAPAPTPL